ncbi:glucose-6-phosphate/phosphate translocator chloroplastic-like [Trifolium pratense]|uniref:Glucose-6-phosphate/phosphate translocator chloroplastic-like n=1 Tax=Trifolium pratense TaxID=57577 RepID=A0A2K3JLZ2_TRIPR|nr:glucose-6-phosphate/phosphate translocator chloroplastic-like [Trifolium pratense]
MISQLNYTLPFSSSTSIPRPKLCTIPTFHNLQNNTNNLSLSSFKPLYISSIENFKFSTTTKLRKSVTECHAYEEADRSQPLEINIGEQAAKFKIGLYFATWWALNVVFNIYNKKVLNAFPYPWLTSTLSLAAGSLIMLISWATRVAEAPKVNLDFWKALFPCVFDSAVTKLTLR